MMKGYCDGKGGGGGGGQGSSLMFLGRAPNLVSKVVETVALKELRLFIVLMILKVLRSITTRSSSNSNNSIIVSKEEFEHDDTRLRSEWGHFRYSRRPTRIDRVVFETTHLGATD